MTKTLRADLPLLDVDRGDNITIHTKVASDPVTGAPTRLEDLTAKFYTGPITGHVLDIRPVPGPTPGFRIDLDDSTHVWTIYTSRYNTNVVLNG